MPPGVRGRTGAMTAKRLPAPRKHGDILRRIGAPSTPYLSMRLKEADPLWRIMSRARLERLDLPSVSPVVYACVIRAISEAIPADVKTADEVRAWLESEAVSAGSWA